MIVEEFGGGEPPSHRPPPMVWMLDGFETVHQWTAVPATGVSLDLTMDTAAHAGGSMRMDFDFHGGGGYAVARSKADIDLPENYEFSFWIRGNTPPQNLEFKLIDPSGENVWWVNRRDFVFPNGWTRVRLKKRHISFAWGPLGGGEMRKVAAIEIAITAGSGGKGSVWIDQLSLEERDPIRPYEGFPIFNATSGRRTAELALDGDSASTWWSEADGAQTLEFNFQASRELGGLVIDWDSLDYAADYTVEASANGVHWDTLHTVRGGDGGRDWIHLPDTETRRIRLAMTRSGSGQGYAVREVYVKPLEWAETRNDFFAALAKEAPRGDYPRYFAGEQSYWTIVGADGDTAEALFGEDGMIEVGKAGFSLEPFLFSGGRLATWADGSTNRLLMDGELPIPSIYRETDGLALTVTSFVAPTRTANASTLWARYRVRNLGDSPRRARLFVALRPFQVNPSSQFLNTTGGAAFVRRIDYDGSAVTVDSARRVVPVTRPAGFGAATFDAGGVIPHLRRGLLPRTQSARDAFGHASGAFDYALDLPARESRDVWIAVPMSSAGEVPGAHQDAAAASRAGEAALARTAAGWREKVGRVEVILPLSAGEIARSLRTNVAFILINRDGPAIQPGSRSYERSWIRDGSLTSTALLRMGHAEAVRDFIEWYAPFQYANGKVPCCVDRRGADPVPEHDSHGQLIHLIAEYHRHTGDRALVRRTWPHVVKAAAYIDTLRQQRRTPRYRQADSLAYFGLVPQSISHEGYSAKPMHSYWDDFFTLAGLKDAAYLAAVLDAPERRQMERMRDEFRADLLASIPRAMALHRIDYIPGAVELGDFDATSTTVGVSPADELRGLPRKPLERTFERYWENFVARRGGRAEWDAYTPYEWRVVGTMVRLGWKERAHQVADWFMTHRRPAAWNSWAEVVSREERVPRFLGDMPHTWVGSDFIRSALDMLAYEGEDGSLVIAAGVPEAWVREAPGVGVRNLSTHFGRLSYTMQAEDNVVRVRFERRALRTPPGGIVIHSPMPRPPREVRADGRVIPIGPTGEVRLRAVPRVVEMRY